MSLALDRKKLKIKHFLDIQSETVGYPTLEDFLYELVNILVEWDSLECDFGVQFSKSRICTTVDKDKHDEYYNELLKLGYIRINEETSQKNKYPLYRLIKHPWMKDDTI